MSILCTLHTRVYTYRWLGLRGVHLAPFKPQAAAVVDSSSSEGGHTSQDYTNSSSSLSSSISDSQLRPHSFENAYPTTTAEIETSTMTSTPFSVNISATCGGMLQALTPLDEQKIEGMISSKAFQVPIMYI